MLADWLDGDGELGISFSDLLVHLADLGRIFILEGLVTVVAAIITPFLLPNDPQTCRFLSLEEKKFVLWRLEGDLGRIGTNSDSEEPFKGRYFWVAVRDWKVWLSIVVVSKVR